MYIVMGGLNHRTAPVEVREKLSFSSSQLSLAFSHLKKTGCLAGCVILSTCNRTEIYATSLDKEKAREEVKSFLSTRSGLSPDALGPHLYFYTCYQAVCHLFRVAAGLDSMVLGETEILGQVREAYQQAQESGATDRVLNTFFRQAIAVGKKVQTQTRIGRSAVSLSSAAVGLAREKLGSLEGQTVLVVGAGKMSNLTAKQLASCGVSTILVANRSYPRAHALAEQFGGQAVRWSDLPSCLRKATVVISCTSAPHYVLRYPLINQVMAERDFSPLVLVDIAVPRDVDPQVREIPGVALWDIDDLQQVVEANLEERKKCVAQAEEIVKEEVGSFFKWLSSLSVVPTIVALREKAQAIKEKELERAFNRLAPLTSREKKVISSLASSLVNQLLHEPVVNLKEYSTTYQGHLYAEVLQKLFNLKVPEEERATVLEAPAEVGRGQG